MNHEIAEHAAHLGAKLLDRMTPGWEQEIADEVFDMSDPERCVLGQVFGDYAVGRRDRLGISMDEAEDHGFELAQYDRNVSRDENYSALQKAWFKEIEQRRCAGRPEIDPDAREKIRDVWEGLGG